MTNRALRSWPLALAAGLAVFAMIVGISQNTGLAAAHADAGAAPLVRFLAGDGNPLRSYEALRTLDAETRGGRMRARLVARTSLDPAHGFRFTVVEEEGSRTILNRVLRPALEAERAALQGNEPGRGAITTANYTFVLGAPKADGLIPIALHPRRADTLLLDGQMWLTGDGDLVSVEGRLTKRPSFWTRRVEVTRQYTRVAGVRVPISMHSRAQVLVVGASTFSTAYRYEAINGTDIDDVPREFVSESSAQ